MQNYNSITRKQTSTGKLVEADFQINSKPFNIAFQSNQEVLTPNLEAYIALALLPSMVKGGGELYTEGEVCEQLIPNLEVIQNVYSSWNTEFKHLELGGVTPVQKQMAQNGRVGAFFSGGVDSFYTLIKNQEDITDLIFVHGWGFNYQNSTAHDKLSDSIRQTAAYFGKNLIEIESNFRDLLDPHIYYPKWGWTISLAIIGNLLYPYLKRLYYSANMDYKILTPTGSLLSPLWYTGRVEFITDGLAISRFDKVASIANHDIVLNNLHVCHKTPKRALNCGRCEKCLRTMVSLEVNDALDKCTTFGRDLDIKFLRNFPVEMNRRVFYLESLEVLEEKGEKRALQSALRTIIKRPKWQTSLLRKTMGLRGKISGKS
jgi:hypothetical protein